MRDYEEKAFLLLQDFPGNTTVDLIFACFFFQREGRNKLAFFCLTSNRFLAIMNLWQNGKADYSCSSAQSRLILPAPNTQKTNNGVSPAWT